ncbi:MAG TPA: type VII secretion system-associated protein, partial [Lentzea sp.]
ANPGYRPSQPGSPTDPVDATLQLLVRGEVDSTALFAVIRESVFDVALDEDGRPIIAPSPDDVPSLLVSTAPAQRFRVQTDRWRSEVTATELSDLLREYEVDVLFNPGGPASIRLIGGVFTENVTV